MDTIWDILEYINYFLLGASVIFAGFYISTQLSIRAGKVKKSTGVKQPFGMNPKWLLANTDKIILFIPAVLSWIPVLNYIIIGLAAVLTHYSGKLIKAEYFKGNSTKYYTVGLVGWFLITGALMFLDIGVPLFPIAVGGFLSIFAMQFYKKLETLPVRLKSKAKAQQAKKQFSGTQNILIAGIDLTEFFIEKTKENNKKVSVKSFAQIEDASTLPIPRVFDLLIIYDSPNLNQRKISLLLDYLKKGGNILIPYSILGKEAFEILAHEQDYTTEFYSATDKKAKHRLVVKDDRIYLKDQEISQDYIEEEMLYYLSLQILEKQKNGA